MKNCFYHPIEAATYACKQCQVSTCDSCSDELSWDQANCFMCQQSLESLGSVHVAEPFWRRLDASFKYVLQKELLVFLIVMSFCSMLVSYLPFSFLWQFLLMAVFIKYCFCCLQASAKGDFTTPDVSRSYLGGVYVLAKLVLVVVLLLAISSASVRFLGVGLGAIFSVIFVAAIPAAIIILALTDSVAEAINPLRLLRLIASIGLPYGLIIAFILMMSSSVALMSNFLPRNTLAISVFLQSFISDFYMVVMFHIMGYLIFQYQDKFGFIAKASDIDFNNRSELEKCKVELSILLKQGEFERLIHRYVEVIKQYPTETSLADRCFDFLYASKNKTYIDEFGCFYLEMLIQQKGNYQLVGAYKRLLLVSPSFKADRAEVRFALAQYFYDLGDFKKSVKLLSGLHKEFSDYSELKEAYDLMADSLKEIPHMQKQERSFRLYSQQLAKQRQQKGESIKKEVVVKSEVVADKPVDREWRLVDK